MPIPDKNALDPLNIYNTALELISILWIGGKCTQQKIADEISNTAGKISTNVDISKAKKDPNVAGKLNPEMIKLVKKLNGSYSNGTFYDAGGNEFKLKQNEIDNRVEYQFGIDDELVINSLRKTKEVRVLTTWAGESYDELIRLTEQIDQFWEKINKVHLLILHPNSLGTYLRSRALGASAEKGFNRIIEDLREITKVHPDIRKKVTVKLYDELPSTKLIILDNITFASFFMYKTRARNGFQFLIDPIKNRDLARNLKANFLRMWGAYEKFDFDKAEQQFDKWKFPAYKRHNTGNYSKFEGTYYFYYPEKYPSDGIARENRVICSIGCNILSIKRENDDTFSCKMKPVGFDRSDYFEGNYYKGTLVNIGFTNPEYLVITLGNNDQNRYLSLMLSLKNPGLRLKEEKRISIFGTFSVIYGASGKIGSGLAALVLAEGKTFEELKAESLDPNYLLTHEDSTHTKNLGIENISHLATKGINLLSWNKEKIKEFGKITNYRGVYNIYAPKGKMTENKANYITIGILEISGTGSVRYKNFKGGHEGIGLATKKEDGNLHIGLINSNPNVARYGTFIIRVGENPMLKMENRLFFGVSASMTWKQIPAEAKIVMERLSNQKYDDLEPKYLPQNDTGIPKEVRGYMQT